MVRVSISSVADKSKLLWWKDCENCGIANLLFNDIRHWFVANPMEVRPFQWIGAMRLYDEAFARAMYDRIPIVLTYHDFEYGRHVEKNFV